MRIVETLPSGYKDKFALVNTTNSGTFYSVVVSQTEPFGSSDIDILKIMIKATELTDNKRFGRAVFDVHINPSNMSCIEKNIVNTCTIKSCSDVASVVGAVLGILFAIVFSILVVLIIKMRKKGGMKEQQTPVQQNKGLSAGNTVESRQSSR
ncbi:unnamed protein product [Mytilus coruscus]|uniref:Uncharacterized protein n=1 Tax=Mytilus coruscus TaxID=42192 RepID=A0A6J8EU93_MYTCO|nr:unnamed protein product [Mytilus coruscus]